MLSRAPVLFVLVAIALVAGCGDDEGESSPTTAATSTAVTGTATPRPTEGASPSVTPAAQLCALQRSLEGAPLTAGLGFELGEERWQFCNGGVAAGSGEKWLFHSQDSGRSWTLISRTTLGNPPPEAGVGDLPNGNSVVVVLFIDSDTGLLGLNSPGENLWRSTDGGHAWTALDVVPPGEVVESITASGGEITVVRSAGTLRTHDNGQTWEDV
jgi:hypothetical protein